MTVNYKVDAFKRYGHIVCNNLLSEEEIKSLSKIYSKIPTCEFVHNPYFKYLRNYSKTCNDIKELAFRGAVPALAKKLLGTPRIRFLFDSLVIKPADAPFTPWHQDQLSLCIDDYRIVTFWIPLQDMTSRHGMIRFAYNEELMNTQNVNLDGFSRGPTLVEEAVINNYEIIDIESLQIGGVTAHAGWTPHGATANSSGNDRTVINIVYVEGDARISRNDRGWEASRDRFFPNKREGDLVDMYPLVE